MLEQQTYQPKYVAKLTAGRLLSSIRIENQGPTRRSGTRLADRPLCANGFKIKNLNIFLDDIDPALIFALP